MRRYKKTTLVPLLTWAIFAIVAGRAGGNIFSDLDMMQLDERFSPPMALTPEAPHTSMRVKFRLGSSKPPFKLQIESGATNSFTVAFELKPQVNSIYVPYAERGKFADEVAKSRINFKDAMMRIDPLGIDYCLLPWFNGARGLYDYDDVNKKVYSDWEKLYPPSVSREFVFEVEYDAKSGDFMLYIDRQYAGRIPSGGKLRRVSCTGSSETSLEWESYTPPPPDGTLKLPALGRAHVSPILSSRGTSPVLKDLRGGSIERGIRNFGGTPIRVFAPLESLDQGLHRQTTRNRDLGWDPMMCRTAFAGGPEYLHYSLPRAFYTHAMVLCADIPQNGREPTLGTSLTRFGNLNSHTIAFDVTCVTNAGVDVRVVGSLEYTRDGKRVTTPLLLVRHRIDIGRILDIINDKPLYGAYRRPLGRQLPNVGDYLDFEFVGSGTWHGFPRSSLQIFGCTLEESPYSVEMAQKERGNIFAGDEKPQTGVELVAVSNNVSGVVVCDIHDAYFKPVESLRVPFTLERAGKAQLVDIPLPHVDLGWYGLRYTFLDSCGTTQLVHEAAFALLGADTREAGFESPYAAWPQLGSYDPSPEFADVDGYPSAGRHNCNPDRIEVARIMHKAGYRSSWHCPVKSEAELPEYKITYSMWHFAGNPGERQTPEELQKRLDEAAVEYRKFREKFPHCNTVMLLHEQGGRDLAQEMLNRKPERGEYLGADGDWRVYFCTEVCKRLRRDFPDCKIMVGNGSSSSEMVASLVRDGFDLSLVDYLGIESKGFQTMPELCDNREAPGMAWALRETGRRFGYDIPVSACNEYVFRPEREVSPEMNFMAVTDYSLRDYLISLGHGMRHISTGHIEDCKSCYYDTNWGAGGQCRFYPYSYPKRLFVGLATLTKVFDKVSLRRRLPTGELSTYALEFARDRKVKDFAYAFWTPRFDVDIAVRFPSGTAVRRVEVFGRERELALTNGEVRIVCGSTPLYLLATAPAVSARVMRHFQRLPAETSHLLRSLTSSDFRVFKTYDLGSVQPTPGVFTLTDVVDAERPGGAGKVCEAALVPGERSLPEVVREYAFLRLRRPIRLRRSEISELGLWVRGNSSFGDIHLVYVDGKGARRRQHFGKICFEGWHLLTVKPDWRSRDGQLDELVLEGIYVSSARQALDPLEMRPVTGHVRLGDIVAFGGDLAGVTDGERDEERHVETMKNVDDKDL